MKLLYKSVGHEGSEIKIMLLLIQSCDHYTISTVVTNTLDISKENAKIVTYCNPLHLKISKSQLLHYTYQRRTRNIEILRQRRRGEIGNRRGGERKIV